MTANTFPWFHAQALRQRFDEHVLHASTDIPLTSEELSWLGQMPHPERNHQPGAADEIRLDTLQAVTAAGAPVALTASWLVSRSRQAAVFFYHPLLGLRKFDSRTHLKHYLIASLHGGETSQALLFLCTPQEHLHLQHSTVSDFQATLVEGSMFDTMMLNINARLSQGLSATLALLREQPTPEALLGQTPYDAMLANDSVARLASYWDTATTTDQPPALQLHRLLQMRFVATLAQQTWEGYFNDREQRQFWRWADDPEAATADLKTFSLEITQADGTAQLIDNLIVLTAAESPYLPCYSYTHLHGLQRHASQMALLANLADPAQVEHWASCVRTRQKGTLHTLRTDGLHLHRLQQPALFQSTRQLLGLQRSNLREGLEQPNEQDPYLICAQALDLSNQLDPRLQRLGGVIKADLRDTPASLDFLARATVSDAQQPNPLCIHLADLDSQYLSYLQRLPNLDSAAATCLELQLATLLGKGPAAATIQLQAPTGGGSLPLTEWFWQRIGTPAPQAEAEAHTPHWEAFFTSPQNAHTPLALLPPALVTQAVASAAHALRQQWIATLAQSERRSIAYRRRLRALLLTLDFTLRQRDNTLPHSAVAVIQAFLEDGQAQAWQLQGDDESRPVPDILLLTSASDADTPLVIWTSAYGFESFTSLAPLNDAVGQWLRERNTHPGGALQWRPLGGDAVRALEQSNSQARQRDCLHAYDRFIPRSLPPSSLSSMVHNSLGKDSLQQQLHRLQQQARTQAVEQAIPAWLARAPAAQQRQYLHALGMNLLASPAERDYLFGIPDIRTYAAIALQAQLDVDFTPGRFHPAGIYLTSRRDIIAPPLLGEIPSAIPAGTVQHRQNLVDYALNHFRDWQYPLVSIELGEGHPAPAALDAEYIRAVVEKLNLGAHYKQWLEERFNATDRDYGARLELYCRQLPAQLLERAWRACLAEGLPQAAVAMLNQVLTMPDAAVRTPLNGRQIDLAPLQLIAYPGMAPDTLPGCYLFCTRDDGPVVLYLPYVNGATLQAFDNGAALLQQITRHEPLQQQLLALMPDALRPRYDYGGFHMPNAPQGAAAYVDDSGSPRSPVALSINPVTGNALHYLFDDNAKHLQSLAQAQWASAAATRWAAAVNVMSLAWEQMVIFLPGKVGLAVAAWQTQMALWQITQTLQQKSWGQTLAELTCALVQGVLVGGHAASLAKRGSPAAHEMAAFWREVRQSAAYGLALASYEAPSATLRSMALDTATHLHLRSDTGEYFASLNGKVYRVALEQGHAYLAGQPADELGPRLRLDAQGRWALDLDQGLPTSPGGVASSLGSSVVRWLVSHSETTVVAVGVRQIRRLMPLRAEMLGSAHRDALEYLATALDNLRLATPVKDAPVQTLHVIRDFFGVVQVSNTLVQRIRETLEKILEVMASRAYSPTTSKRYVMATAEGSAASVAFTAPQDPTRQIFLLDEFFDFDGAQHFALLPQHPAAKANAISRAMVLIHEFSHVACDTRDIRYLEASTPYVELLQPGRRRAWLNRQHDESFSHRTDPKRLFIVRDTQTGRLRDLRNDDRKGRALILSITASADLHQARQRFMHDAQLRAKIILMNADSVTLLAYRLGQVSERQGG